jgi:hypothetical protein
MGVYCINDDYCVSGTGFPIYNDVYSQSGTYNSRDYYVGNTNGYYIFYDSDSFWCLSTSLGSGPCFLQGKYPYSGLCPDLSFVYVNSSLCPTPTPTPTLNCDVFEFKALFDTDVTPTPTVSITRTHTPTRSSTPTSTNNCPLIYVNASVNSITNTPTPTPSITPSIRVLRYRNNQIQCNFSGDVTFTTVNTVISCPISKIFQDCSNGEIYYTTSNLINPSGGPLNQFMIFESTVDGIYRCISYLGTDRNLIGSRVIVLNSGPIGHSNLGECSLCAITPTPTPTMTPTIPVPTEVPECIVYYLSSGGVYSYEPTFEIITTLTVPDSLDTTGLAISPNLQFLYEINENTLRRWEIVSTNPFVSNNAVDLSILNSSTLQLGNFIVSLSSNSIISVDISSNPHRIIRISTPALNTSATYSHRFPLPINRVASSAALYVSTGKLIIITSEDNDWYLNQYDYLAGESQLEILVSPTITNAAGIFVYENILYVSDIDGNLFTIETQPPYTITAINSIGNYINGMAQILSCVDLEFEVDTLTYYAYRLCLDNEGAQTFVYQTVPSITTNLSTALFDVTTSTCWSFWGIYSSIPQNTTNDIIVYQGNYFTEVLSTVYSNCTDCLESNPCVRPSGLINLNFRDRYDINNGPSISLGSTPVEICSTWNELQITLSENPDSLIGFQGVSVQVESLEIGSIVYQSWTSTDCFFRVVDGLWYVNGYIVETIDGIITYLEPCTTLVNCYEIYIQVSTNPSTICAGSGSPIYVYGDEPNLYDGMVLYSDSSCTTPLTPDFGGINTPTINYVKMMGSGFPTRYQMNNNGIITIYNC